jgi:hypothetical protein
MTVHRVVALSFLSSSYFEGAVVNHKNGIKSDNNVDNLEWCTAIENTAHAKKNGLMKAWNKGKTGVYSKALIEQMANNMPHRRRVVVIDHNGISTTFRSIRECCLCLKLDRGSVVKALNGKTNSTIKNYEIKS